MGHTDACIHPLPSFSRSSFRDNPITWDLRHSPVEFCGDVCLRFKSVRESSILNDKAYETEMFRCQFNTAYLDHEVEEGTRV
jgi:hypothetical protein